jgi:hypothetical protein
VVAWNDGGGKVRATLRPIEGRERVIAFMAGLVARYPFGEARVVEVNGAPALAVDGIEQVVTVSVHERRIDGIQRFPTPTSWGTRRVKGGGAAPVRRAPCGQRWSLTWITRSPGEDMMSFSQNRDVTHRSPENSRVWSL